MASPRLRHPMQRPMLSCAVAMAALATVLLLAVVGATAQPAPVQVVQNAPQPPIQPVVPVVMTNPLAGLTRPVSDAHGTVLPRFCTAGDRDTFIRSVDAMDQHAYRDLEAAREYTREVRARVGGDDAARQAIQTEDDWAKQNEEKIRLVVQQLDRARDAARTAPIVDCAPLRFGDGFFASVQMGAAFPLATTKQLTQFPVGSFETKLDSGPGPIVGGTFGYQAGPWSAGLQYIFTNNPATMTTIPGFKFPVSGNTQANSFMAIGSYDFTIAPTWPVTPHLGFGVGVADLTTHQTYRSITPPGINSSSTVFAYEGFVGVDWAIAPNLALTLDFLHLGTDHPTYMDAFHDRVRSSYTTNSVLIGLRYNFGTAPPPPPPPIAGDTFVPAPVGNAPVVTPQAYRPPLVVPLGNPPPAVSPPANVPPPAMTVDTPPQAQPVPAAPPCDPLLDAMALTSDEFVADLADFFATRARTGTATTAGDTPIDPVDINTQRRWDQALRHEDQVQRQLLSDFGEEQAKVAWEINAYLGATSAWQERYARIASSSIQLQGLLADWTESREIYEDADLAFAAADLAVGAGKLGFKTYKWATRTKALVAVAEGTKAATVVAKGEKVAAVVAEGEKATTVAAEGGRVATTGAEGGVDLAKGSNPNRAILPPGDILPYEHPIPIGEFSEFKLPELPRTPSTPPADLARPFQARVDYIQRSADLFRNPAMREPLLSEADAYRQLEEAAHELGIDPELAARAEPGMDPGEAVMQAIARQRGWHEMPEWAYYAVQKLLLESRNQLAGVIYGARPKFDARIIRGQIDPATLEIVRSLKTYVETLGVDFSEYLRTVAAEVEEVATNPWKGDPNKFVSPTANTVHEDIDVLMAPRWGIVQVFDTADIDLLNKILASGGDIDKLRALVGPVEQVSLNALARASAKAACEVVTLTKPPPAPGAPLTEQQVHNMLFGTGELGTIGLANIVDQFGLSERIKDHGLLRASLGEMWELFTSPSATAASHVYSHVALSEYQELLERERPAVTELGSKLDEAARALANLQAALRYASLTGPDSYVSKTGPDELRKILDDLQKVFDGGSPGWQKDHKDQLDARRDHITQKLADLANAMQSVRELAGRMANLRQWLDTLRLNPDRSVKPPIEAFNPEIYVRLNSIALYLRGMGASVFGLSDGKPFQVVATREAQGWLRTSAKPNVLISHIEKAPEVEMFKDLDEFMKGVPEDAKGSTLPEPPK